MKRLIIIMIILLASGAAFAGQFNSIGQPVNITLQWEPLSDPDIRGYRVFFGNTNPPANLLYTGPVTSLDITVYAGKTYYFAIQSIDIYGNADPISEVMRWYAVPSDRQGIYIERKVRKLWLTY